MSVSSIPIIFQLKRFLRSLKVLSQYLIFIESLEQVDWSSVKADLPWGQFLKVDSRENLAFKKKFFTEK